MTWIFPPSIPYLPVLGQESRYPVRRIFCVGRNYAAHAREMGADPNREPPFYFTKSPDNLVPGGGPIPYPQATANLHHEVELVIALDHGAAIFGYGVGLDLTRRDLQNAAKDKGRPWDLGKSFEHAAPCSALVRNSAPLDHGSITLMVNGETRQKGDLAHMLWSIPEIIGHLSNYYHLGAGDLIFTGTPEGVGPIRPGDKLQADIPGVGQLEVEIT